MSADEPLAITCPRCGVSASARFYGPCDTCRATLRATLGGEARALETADYEPKMNVTPNAVALKD
jgi:ribosomal protein S27E